MQKSAKSDLSAWLVEDIRRIEGQLRTSGAALDEVNAAKRVSEGLAEEIAKTIRQLVLTLTGQRAAVSAREQIGETIKRNLVATTQD